MLYQLSYIGEPLCRSLANNARDFASGLPLRSRPLNGSTSARKPCCQLSAVSQILICVAFFVGVQHIFAAEHRLHREQRQDQQRSCPQFWLGERHPSQRSQHGVADQRDGQTIHRSAVCKISDSDKPDSDKSWCTGKDSNLRTSLGGTDLQSVGFNHSPTCAKLSGDAASCPPSSRPPRWAAGKRSRSTRNTKSFATFSQHRETKARAKLRREDRRSLHAGKVPNGVRWKDLLRRYRVRCTAGKFVRFVAVLWSWRRESNPRPSDYKSDALPTELRQQLGGKMRLRAN